jgi:UDP-galactopyranose mutase
VDALSSRRNPDVGVIALVPDSWGDPWMPRHQVLRRLARHFEVVWIERSLGWREYWVKGRTGRENMQSVSSDIDGFTLYDPGRWLPEVFNPRGLGEWLRRERVRRARAILERRGCKRIVLYLWRPEFDWALEATDADFTCYHIDDEYQFSVTEQPNDPREVALMKRVDHVIIHSPRLLQKKGHINPSTAFVPNGVDYGAYSRPTTEPADLAPIAHPRMGYVGVIKTQLDFELLLGLATAHPEWSFVMVGPRGYVGDRAGTLDQMAALPNVHLLGNKQLAELPSYTQHLDVCLMCYEVTDYTNYIYPLKLHEYLGSGPPVVSSPIQSVLSFSNVVRLASNPAEWERALSDSLSAQATSPEAVAARRAVAAEHDWDRLVEKIAEQFRTGLEKKSTVAKPHG